MFKDLNYLSPVCTMIDVYGEGMLCASVDELNADKTETFDSLTDFEW
jgi:hypothetical protein